MKRDTRIVLSDSVIELSDQLNVPGEGPGFVLLDKGDRPSGFNFGFGGSDDNSGGFNFGFGGSGD